MRILVVGGGGREHALCWKIAQSPLVDGLYAAPGNPGIAELAECVDIGAEDIPALTRFAADQRIDFVVVGPEVPLAAGLVDELGRIGIEAFGPTRAAAELEGSKAFAKEIMAKNGIPTARAGAYRDERDAHAHINGSEGPLVVKADGLAAGKGVIVCDTKAEAHEAIVRIMGDHEFGAAGSQVVIEDRLFGEEASVLAVTDGKTILTLESAQDHKPAFDGDTGPNTGGMGAYSPAPVVTPEMHREIERKVLVPTVHGMKRQGRRFRGCLYGGMMITKSGPMTLEFNVRFGDPETQPLMVRLKSDIVPILLASARGELNKVSLEWNPGVAVCVVMASGGYPGEYEKGAPIHGLDRVAGRDDVVVFHAGTRKERGQLVTNGGRVLGVTARGETVEDARRKAYEAVEQINFAGAHYRTDIAAKALNR